MMSLAALNLSLYMTVLTRLNFGLTMLLAVSTLRKYVIPQLGAEPLIDNITGCFHPQFVCDSLNRILNLTLITLLAAPTLSLYVMVLTGH
jgi:hypothetical protein